MSRDAGSERLARAIAGIDAANSADPNRTEAAGESRPAELVYGERMSAALGRLYPKSSDELRIAARAQHIRRWTVPRTGYPEGRRGYLAWRNHLKRFHAEQAGAIMEQCGYAPEAVARVGALVRKEGLKRDPEAQALEDAACLVFLEHYFADFAAKHDDGKLVGILRKTWAKMSETARAAARTLNLSGRPSALLARALEDSG